MLPRLPRSLQFVALSACLAAAASSFACSSDSGDDSEPKSTTGSGSGGKGGSNGSGNAAGEGGDGSGGDPGSGSGSGAEGGDSSSGGTKSSSGGKGGSDGSGSGGRGGTDPTGGTGGTDPTGPDLEAIARGQAIAEHIDINCSACHGINYAGSPLYFAGNITPDEATGIGAWSDEELAAAITEGIGRDGSPLCSTMEPYDFDEGEVSDVIAFLRSLTPISKTLAGSCED